MMGFKFTGKSVVAGLATLLASLLFSLSAAQTPGNLTDNQTGNLADTWHGTLKTGQSEMTLVFHLRPKCCLDSPDQGAFGVPATLDTTYLFGLRISIPSIMASFTGVPFKGRINGIFSQGGQSIPLSLEPGEPILVARPQTPVPPFPYQTRDISLPSGDILLAGTLSLPDEALRSEGISRGSVHHNLTDDASSHTPDATIVTPGSLRGTAVLFVSGSGLQNRDEEIFGHKPFAVLADALARNGVSSLRCDDRGFGESGGDASTATTRTFADDAAAGVAFLRSCGFDKVGIVGHSEGGTIAMMLATEPDAPDFIVSLAGMADRGDSTIFRQGVKLLTLDGMREAQAERQAEIILEQNKVSGNAWMKFFLNLNPAEFIGKIHCPFLALNGEKDCQVLPEYNLTKIKALCPESDTRLLPGLNHLFQHCDTGLVVEYNRISETISPEIIDIIVSWISALQ